MGGFKAPRGAGGALVLRSRSSRLLLGAWLRWALAAVVTCMALVVPATAMATTATAISAGYEHTCALTSARRGQVLGRQHLRPARRRHDHGANRTRSMSAA